VGLVPNGIDNQVRSVARFLSMVEKSEGFALSEIRSQHIYDRFEEATDKGIYIRSTKTS
jgi:hypothetical protein